MCCVFETERFAVNNSLRAAQVHTVEHSAYTISEMLGMHEAK